LTSCFNCQHLLDRFKIVKSDNFYGAFYLQKSCKIEGMKPYGH